MASPPSDFHSRAPSRPEDGSAESAIGVEATSATAIVRATFI
jgi:hypothetical protein